MAATFGAPVTDPQGKVAPEEVGQVGVGAQPRRDRGGELPDRAQPLHLEERPGLHRPGRRHASQVVAEQVGDHHVLGTVLLRGEEPEPHRLVLLRETPAPRRSLHGPGDHRVSAPEQEELGRGRDHRAGAGPDVGRVPRSLCAAQPQVEGERVAVQPAPETERQVHLVDRAGGHGLPDHLDRGRVVRGVHLRHRIDEARVGGTRRQRGERGVVDSEPGERAGARSHAQGRIEGRRGLVGHGSHHPASGPGGALRGLDGWNDVGEGAGLDHLARRAEGQRAPARRVELEEGVDRWLAHWENCRRSSTSAARAASGCPTSRRTTLAARSPPGMPARVSNQMASL